MLTKCKILVAGTAGFCFGVDRAVKIVYNNLNNLNNVVTLGPIIHNQSVVSDLESKGVRVVNDVDDVKSGQTVIIRSHGVSADVYKRLSEMNVNVVDATCPFVSRIHKIVKEKSRDGYLVAIAGDKTHPEVIGISGHCESECYVFSQLDELKLLLSQVENENMIFVAQTTFNKQLWERCKEYIQSVNKSALIFDTICDATSKRQEEAISIASKADKMIIVGDRHSSNTLKLKSICSEYCPCYLVEEAKELYDLDFYSVHYLGISAGASTPAYIIQEVKKTMSDILENKEEEFNFEEAIEQSLKRIYIGARVTGIVTAVNKTEVLVDIGTKHTGVIPRDELSADSSKLPEEVVSVGDEVEVIVLKTNDQEGVDTLSKKQVDAMVGFENVVKAYEEKTVLTGVVTNILKRGVLVSTKGFKVFIPASQATERRGDSLDDLLNKTVDFKIIDVDKTRNRAVGSIRIIATEKRAEERAKFFESAEVGQVVTGKVKSVTDYGAFVDLGGVDGLVRKIDLTWARIKHPSDVVSVGDEIEVTIKSIDKESEKVSLSLKKEEDNPWIIFSKNYGVGQVITVKIVSITSFGAFAQIIEGIDGLIHISQIANQRVDNVADILSVGQEVEVKITEIDEDNKRISLSMRALLPEPEKVEKPVEEEDTAEALSDEPNVVYSTENPPTFDEEEEPTEEKADEAVEETAEEPALDKAEEPAEESVEEPTEEKADEAVEETAEEPVPEKVEEPAEESAEEPTEEKADEVAEETAEEPAQEKAEEPAEESAEEPAEESAEEPTEEKADEAVEETAEEPVPEKAEEPAVESAE